MSAEIKNNLYTIDPQTQFYSVNIDNVTDQQTGNQVIKQVSYDARIEVLKSIAHYLIAGAVTLAIAAITIVAFKVSAVFIGIFTFPLAVIPPLYSLATSFGGLIVGGVVGYVIFKKYATGFIDQAKLHWNHAQHLYAQRDQVADRIKQLPND
ncbi:MAG: hypothetical protein JSS30_05010 [Verrucomicrobia bacterium]|nr:hypothetical protein [Verrucomicrobiota bacterium]